MKTSVLSVPLLLCLAAPAIATATNVVEKALASYDSVQTVSCEVRRTVESAASRDSVTFLSRVYFQRPDRLHVDNVAPQRRRIVADGTNFFSHIAGARKGFSRPITDLDAEHQVSLRKVPGTPMDHLLRLKGIEARDLAPLPAFPVRQGFETGNAFAVVSEDATGRVARIEFFRDSTMKERTAAADYSAFVEGATGVWFPTRHKTTVTMNGVTSTESVSMYSLSVNEPVAQSLFIAAPFFKGVEFVDNYKALSEQ